MDHAGEADRLVGEFGAVQVGAAAGGVALVEDQVEDVQDGVQAALFEGGPGGFDLLLGAADPGGHRGLGDQEGPGHLGGGEAADGPQGEGDLRGRGQRGVAAQEQQVQGVVVA